MHVLYLHPRADVPLGKPHPPLKSARETLGYNHKRRSLPAERTATERTIATRGRGRR